MSLCTFCDREFLNDQAVKAHLRWCPNYENPKKGTATRIHPIAPSLLPRAPGSSAPNNLTTASDLADQMTRQFAGPDEVTRLRQRREALLAGLYSSLVDWYCPLEGVVTPAMAAAAKVAILNELGVLPIEALAHTELALRGTAIRNRVFGPHLRQQQEQRAREQERQHQDTLRHQQDSDTRARQVTRKAALVELGLARTLNAALSRGITGRALAGLEWEVRARLEALLVGDETGAQVEETIAASIERPLLEWETRLAHVQRTTRERILTHCLTVAVPVAEAVWPWVKDTVIAKMCEHWGLQTSPEPPSPMNDDHASSEKQSAPATSEAPPPHSVRRRRTRATGSIVTGGPIVSPSEPAGSESLVRNRAGS